MDTHTHTPAQAQKEINLKLIDSIIPHLISAMEREEWLIGGDDNFDVEDIRYYLDDIVYAYDEYITNAKEEKELNNYLNVIIAKIKNS